MTDDLTRLGAEARRQVNALDQAVFDAVAKTPSPLLDRIMPRVSDAADYSKLWLGAAGLLALVGSRRGRRAALRGVVTLGATSLVVNAIVKRLRPRTRPVHHVVPVGRRSRRIPTSNSFPSGHAASAAAFAEAVGYEAPGLAVPLRALAALVGFSRVATGAHYPSDVVAGSLLGWGVAAIGRRLVPPVPMPPVSQPREIVSVPGRRTGAGVVLVVNPASHSGQGAKVLRRVRRALRDVRVVQLRPGDDLADVCAKAAAQAEVLAVAGGDGTVGAAAEAAIERGIPLAVFPAGTFNHFAKAIHSYPLSAAIRAVRTGTVAKVDVGYLNDGIFLNTASVGAYPEFVRIREGLERRIGKPLAALVAAVRTISRENAVRLRVDDVTSDSSLVFIGNGQYFPQGFAPSVRQNLADGLIDLRILDTSTRWARVKVLAATLTGQFGRLKEYHEVSAAELLVELPDGPQRVARDGELGEVADELRLRIARRALTVYAPHGSADDD